MQENRLGVLFSLLLVSFLAAFPFKLERNYQFLRLRSIVLDSCPSIRIEKKILSYISPDAIRFWPLSFTLLGDLDEAIEKSEPLSIDTQIGWGTLSFRLKPLTVLSTFSWGKTSWYLSREGKVWSEDHPMNEEIYGKPDDPLVVIDESMPPPIKASSKNQGSVMDFNYDLDDYSSMIKELTEIELPGEVQSLRVYREGGMGLASLYIKKENKGFLTVIIDRDKNLHSQISAVNELLSSGVKFRSGEIVDASYGDKIVVKGLSD
jgi:hypothetical protein